MAKVMIELFEEQAKMLHEHANRLRKALGDAPAEESPVEGAKGKKGKKSDKPIVKRALSGFQVFMKEHLKSYRVRHPEIAPKEVLTIISQRWKSLPEDKKSKYLQEAAKLNKEAGKGGAEVAAAHEEHEDVHDEPTVSSSAATESAKKRKRSESEADAGSGDEKKKKKHKKHKKHEEDSS